MSGKKRRKKKARQPSFIRLLIPAVLLAGFVVVLVNTNWTNFFFSLAAAKWNPAEYIPALTGNISPQDKAIMPIKGDGLTVTFLDVGQGDCILIRSGREAMLVDAGTNESGTSVIDYLNDAGITELTYVIGTHPHEDHIGGLDQVIQTFITDCLIMPEAAHTTRTYEDVLDAAISKDLKITRPVPGTVYPLGDAAFTIIAPVRSDYEEKNNWSIGIRVDYGSTSFIMCGDAEALAELDILNSGANVKANVLKVGHHGSSTSTSDAFLAAVNPDFAVISCGKDNTYGHPHDETLTRLKGSGTHIYRTDEQGTVTAHSDGISITWDQAPYGMNGA